MTLLNTKEAANRLNVSPIRVRQLIQEGKLKANRVGRDYIIEEEDLASVQTYGKAGRPKSKAQRP
jgi:excisionase family DNA binding protein